MRQGFQVAIVSVLTCAAVLLPGVRSTLMGQAAGARRIVVIGCIQRAVQGQAGGKNAEFTITDFRGGPLSKFRLDANDDKLIPWLGYTAEITGRVAAGYRVGSNEIPRLNVEKVDRISRSCNALEAREGENR